MKKDKWMKIALLLLPLLTVAVASAAASVTVFDGVNTAYYSWHQVVDQSSFGWCAPVAVVMNYVVFVLAMVYFLKKKDWCLTGIFYIAFAAACVAVLPIVIPGDVKVIPNVMGVIFLMAESLLAKVMMKKQPETPVKNGRRLANR